MGAFYRRQRRLNDKNDGVYYQQQSRPPPLKKKGGKNLEAEKRGGAQKVLQGILEKRRLVIVERRFRLSLQRVCV